MKTKITELLNIEYPIIQGAMAWVSDGKLAGAVSKAGGAGTIAAGGRTAEWVKEQICIARSITDKAFGVNIMLMANNCDEIVDVVCEAKIAYVTLGAGNPVPYFEKLQAAGIKVIPVVPSVKLAKRVAEKGADALIIEGMEAGGHIGKLTTMALMTQVIPEIDIPIVVAGGIADGRGFAATLLMGADGVQIGTRFYASEECSAHINAKKLIVEAVDTDTVITGALHNHAVRGIQNAMTTKYLELERSGVPESELEKVVIGTSRKASVDGDVEWGFVQAGQSLSVINKIESCNDIIKSLVTGAEAAIKNVQKYQNLKNL